MSDVFFVLKCFVYTIMITFLMQIKISGVSLESRAEYYLKNSVLTDYLQSASSGGTRMILDGYEMARVFIKDSTRSFGSSESHESKAAGY